MLLLLIAHVDALVHLSDVLRPRKAVEVSCRIPVEGYPPGLRPALLILMLLSDDLFWPFRGGLQRHLVLAHHDGLEFKLQRPPGGLQGRLLWLEKPGVQHRGLDSRALCLVVEGLNSCVLVIFLWGCQPCPLIYLQG
jgi:hypothetical protein